MKKENQGHVLRYLISLSLRINKIEERQKESFWRKKMRQHLGK